MTPQDASALLWGLETIPDDLLSRMCPAERAVMLAATSKHVLARLKRATTLERVPAVLQMKCPAKWNHFRWKCWLAGAAQMKWLNQPPLKLLVRELPRLQSWCSIMTLNLSDCWISARGASDLAMVLGQCSSCNTSLTALNLAGNGIGEAGARSLVGVLGDCFSLEELNLGRNNIGDEGARSLRGMLGQCSSLMKLHLGGNDIGDEGAGSLGDVLEKCSKLAELNLSVNRIAAVGAERLVLAWVLGCSSLERLHLGRNEFGVCVPDYLFLDDHKFLDSVGSELLITRTKNKRKFARLDGQNDIWKIQHNNKRFVLLGHLLEECYLYDLEASDLDDYSSEGSGQEGEEDESIT